MRVFHFLLRDLRTVEQASAVSSFGINNIVRAMNSQSHIFPIDKSLDKRVHRSIGKPTTERSLDKSINTFDKPRRNRPDTRTSIPTFNPDMKPFLICKSNIEQIERQQAPSRNSIDDCIEEYGKIRSLNFRTSDKEKVDIQELYLNVLLKSIVEGEEIPHVTLVHLVRLAYDISRTAEPSSDRCTGLYAKIYDQVLASERTSFLSKLNQTLRNCAPWLDISKINDSHTLEKVMGKFWTAYESIDEGNPQRRADFLQKCNIVNMLNVATESQDVKMFESLYPLLPQVYSYYKLNNVVYPSLLDKALSINAYEAAKIIYPNVRFKLSSSSIFQLTRLASINYDPWFTTALANKYFQLTKKLEPELLYFILHSQMGTHSVSTVIKSIDSSISNGIDISLEFISPLANAYRFDPFDLEKTTRIAQSILKETKHVRTKRLLMYSLLKFMIQNAHSYKNAYVIVNSLLTQQHANIFNVDTKSSDIAGEEKEISALISLMCHCLTLVPSTKLAAFEFFKRIKIFTNDRKLEQIDYIQFIKSQMNGTEHSTIYIYLIYNLQDHGMLKQSVLNLLNRVIKGSDDNILKQFVKYYRTATNDNTEKINTSQLEYLKEISDYDYTIATIFMPSSRSKVDHELLSGFDNYSLYGDLSFTIFNTKQIHSLG